LAPVSIIVKSTSSWYQVAYSTTGNIYLFPFSDTGVIDPINQSIAIVSKDASIIDSSRNKLTVKDEQLTVLIKGFANITYER
jgi:hypothetical protein